MIVEEFASPVHFVWSGPDWGLSEELAVRSAAKVHAGDVVIWVIDPPDQLNRSWARTVEFDRIQLEPADRFLREMAIEHLRTVKDRAHFADFVRYRVLWERGGLYLDTDTVSIRPLDQIVPEKSEVVAGWRADQRMVPNSVVLSLPRSDVMMHCSIRAAARFRGEWGACGPTLLTEVCQELGDCVTVLPSCSFHSVPPWSPGQVWDDAPLNDGMYVLHFFSSQNRKRLNDLGGWEETLYHRAVKAVLGEWPVNASINSFH